MNGDSAASQTSYGAEVVRKGIHLFSLSIPIVYYFLSKETALTILLPLTAFFVANDLARLYVKPFGRFYEALFGSILRSHERNDRGRRLTGASYVLISATLCVWLFPKVIFLAAFAILIVSDSAAALVGRRLGRRPFLAKSLEGTTAFFVSALIVVGLAPKVIYSPTEYLIGAVAALLGAVVEAAPQAVDDNLAIPLAIGTFLWLLYAVFLPGVNIYALDVPR
jgi:dolichol kinase